MDAETPNYLIETLNSLRSYAQAETVDDKRKHAIWLINYLLSDLAAISESYNVLASCMAGFTFVQPDRVAAWTAINQGVLTGWEMIAEEVKASEESRTAVKH